MSTGIDVEIFWFSDCPNHEAAETIVREVARDLGLAIDVRRTEVPDERMGRRVRFPGSPTIRVDGLDIEPGWEPCDDCPPRCRVYATRGGLRGILGRDWVRDALLAARR